MNFKVKLDFCVIPSPYNQGRKNLVFVSYRGSAMIDEKLCEEQDYELLKYTMNKMGYQEIDFCTFESSNNSSIGSEELKHKLAEAGLHYSKPLEFNVMSELNSFHKELMEFQQYKHENNSIFFTQTHDKVEPINTKYKVPEVDEKISLYFYLFLQCNFLNDHDCILQIAGDLYSKENNNTRNYLQIAKSDFIRLKSDTPSVIILQSVKTWGDFIKDIDFLHKGKFVFQKPSIQDGNVVIKTKEFTYDIMSIKTKINPAHKIILEIDVNQFYDEVIENSKKIKKEQTLNNKKIVSLELLRPEILLLRQKIKDKMLYLAEVDEFEQANKLKKDMGFVDDKLSIIDALEEKSISNEEYGKNFCLSS